MKKNSFLKLYVWVVFAGLTAFMPILSPKTSGVNAQEGIGNRISGYVFGFQRTPLDRVDVELLDDLNRTINRTRTNGSGLYVFYGMTQGRYIVRVLPFTTDYEEQEAELEIINIVRTSTNQVTGGGRGAISAPDNKQQDFYLKTRQGAITGTTGAIFVQDIPKEAKTLYEKGLDQLRDNKQKEAFASLIAAIEKYPTYYYAMETLGTEYVRLRYYEAAQVLLANAVEINPRGYRSWYGLAYSFSALGKPSAALAASEKAIELNPNSAEALLIHGVILRQNKKFDQAEKQYIKAKGLNIKSYMPEIHRQLGFLYGYEMKRYADAVRELKLYLKARPDGKESDDIKKRIKELEEKAASA
jgi:tetratricopeptide (TPR) repeat protein